MTPKHEQTEKEYASRGRRAAWGAALGFTGMVLVSLALYASEPPDVFGTSIIFMLFSPLGSVVGAIAGYFSVRRQPPPPPRSQVTAEEQAQWAERH